MLDKVIKEHYKAKVLDVREFRGEKHNCVAIVIQNEDTGERERYDFDSTEDWYEDVVLMIKGDMVEINRYDGGYLGNKFTIELA